MYKPHTIEQYKVYRFLEENFALEHFLLAPLSRFGLILEDKTGEKIAFAFLNNCVQEIPVPAPADPETVTAFLKQFRSLTPHPVIHDFEALTRWWLDNPNPLTYQQALGMSDDLYRHFGNHVGLERLSAAHPGAGYQNLPHHPHGDSVFPRQLRQGGNGAHDGLHHDYGAACYRAVPDLPEIYYRWRGRRCCQGVNLTLLQERGLANDHQRHRAGVRLCGRDRLTSLK